MQNFSIKEEGTVYIIPKTRGNTDKADILSPANKNVRLSRGIFRSTPSMRFDGEDSSPRMDHPFPNERSITRLVEFYFRLNRSGFERVS